METLIIISLLIIICLLVHDKVIAIKSSRRDKSGDYRILDLPEIMGRPKTKKRLVTPTNSNGGQKRMLAVEDSNFDPEVEDNSSVVAISREELDEVVSDARYDFEEEEEEWIRYGAINDGDGFAKGVTFEELSTVETLLRQQKLEPGLKEQAVDIVRRIQGTELFSLLESSMQNAAQRIAGLLDNSMENEAAPSSSKMRTTGLNDFEIGDFI